MLENDGDVIKYVDLTEDETTIRRNEVKVVCEYWKSLSFREKMRELSSFT